MRTREGWHWPWHCTDGPVPTEHLRIGTVPQYLTYTVTHYYVLRTLQTYEGPRGWRDLRPGEESNAHQPQLPHDSIQTTLPIRAYLWIRSFTEYEYSGAGAGALVFGRYGRWLELQGRRCCSSGFKLRLRQRQRQRQPDGTTKPRLLLYGYLPCLTNASNHLTSAKYLHSQAANPNHPPQIPMTASLVRDTQKGLVPVNTQDIIFISTRGT